MSTGVGRPKMSIPMPWHPVLLDPRHPRAAQKAKVGGEMFVANSSATPDGTRSWTSSKSTRTPATQKASSPSTSERCDDHQRTAVQDHQESTRSVRAGTRRGPDEGAGA